MTRPPAERPPHRYAGRIHPLCEKPHPEWPDAFCMATLPADDGDEARRAHAPLKTEYSTRRLARRRTA